MEANVVYQRLKQIFPHHLQNINVFQISPKTIDAIIPNNLPFLPLAKIHSLCQSQQTNVMNKVLQIKQMDLYDQMASVCPNKDLKLMRTYSHQQVNQKIHHYSSQISQSQQKYNKSNINQNQSDIIQLQDQDINIKQDQHMGNQKFNQGLRNIFEQYDNNFSWSQLNIYDLH